MTTKHVINITYLHVNLSEMNVILAYKNKKHNI